MQGWVFDIQHFSTHDGPGIRTVVFLQGCPLRCQWCHNPEGLCKGEILAYTNSKCVSCGRCVEACERNAHTIADNHHILSRQGCTSCGRCTQVCPSGALGLVGQRMSVDDVVEEVVDDIPFYQSSGGGLTLSGGEPLSQADFSLALLGAAGSMSLNTCVETCGFGRGDDVLAVAERTDLFLFDLKQTDDRLHKTYTGRSNRLIMDNLSTLCQSGARVRLRLPWIPGVNNTEEHLQNVAGIYHRHDSIESVEIVPYHSLGMSKTARLGQKSVVTRSFDEPTDCEVDLAKTFLRDQHVNVHGTEGLKHAG